MNSALVVMMYDRTGEQYELSRKAVESALAQDIPVDVYVVNNGSTCESTLKWLSTITDCTIFSYAENISPCKRANDILRDLFGLGYPHVLGFPNDVIAPPNLYRKMLERPEWIVTPGMHGEDPPIIMEEVQRIHGDCHTSVMLVHKQAHDALVAQDGYFIDEGMFMYASDCDLKVRLAKYKIPTAQLDILCWHYGGASHRLGIGAADVYRQADADRDYFAKKWGWPVGSEEYAKFLQELG